MYEIECPRCGTKNEIIMWCSKCGNKLGGKKQKHIPSAESLGCNDLALTTEDRK